MARWIRRPLRWVVFLFFLSLLAFFSLRLMPTSPEQLYLAWKQLPPTEENLMIVRKQFGLDGPLTYQYVAWLRHFLQGDWGTSLITRLDVRREMMRRLPISAAIGMGGLGLAGVFGFFLGFGAAACPGGGWDRLSRGLSIFTKSIPVFILGMILLETLQVRLNILDPLTHPWQGVVVAMGLVALYQMAPLSRIVKRHFEETKEKTYMQVLLLRGMPLGRTLLRDGYEDALYGLLAAMTSLFTWALGGTAVVEFLFGLPGLSGFLISSVASRDYTVIQSYILFIGIWMCLVHSSFEVILAWLRRGDRRED